MNTITSSRIGRRDSQRWLAGPILVFWLAVIPLDLAKDIVAAAIRGLTIGPSLLREPVLWWGVWLLVTPLLTWLARRVHPENIGWPAAVSAHAVAGLVVVFLASAVSASAFLVTGTMWDSTWASYYLALLDNQFVPSYALYLGAVGSCFLYDHFERLRSARLASIDARARAEALEATAGGSRFDRIAADLQPAFLRRALAAVARLIEERRQDEAVDAVAHLGDLLRTSLRKESSMISLERELELFEAYTSLESAGSGRSVRFVRDIGSDVGNVLVPPLLLQPLVPRVLARDWDDSHQELVVRISAHREGSATRILVGIDPSLDPTVPDDLTEGLRRRELTDGESRVLEAWWRGDSGSVLLGPEERRRD